MKSMTLRQEVAQLVFIEFHGGSPNTRSRDYLKFVRLIRDTNVGGLILINAANGRGVQKAEPYALAAFLNRMQRLARVPLMVGADFERGASMRVSGTTAFPQAMAFGAAGDPSLTRFEGEVTAREARALGIQWVYYPGGRRQQQSRQSHHQYPLLRRESAGRRGPRESLHRGRAFRQAQLRPHHRQTFSGARRHCRR